MKKYTVIIMVILFMITLFSSACSSNDNRRINKNNVNKNRNISGLSSKSKSRLSKNDLNKLGKVLVVYYSLTGNTRKVANIITNMTEGDIFEIQPVYDYSKVTSMTEMEQIGKKQINEGYKPKLKKSVSNIEAYDLIVVGSPVWWFSVSPPVMSFLSQYDLKGKKVAPFCTYISAYGGFFTQFQKAIPGAKVCKGLIITESELMDEKNVNEKIETWLREISGGN